MKFWHKKEVTLNCKTVNQFHILVYDLSYNKYLTLTLFLQESKDDQGVIFFRTCGNIDNCPDFHLDKVPILDIGSELRI